MKLLCILALGVSSLAFAGGNTGGTPTVLLGGWQLRGQHADYQMHSIRRLP